MTVYTRMLWEEDEEGRLVPVGFILVQTNFNIGNKVSIDKTKFKKGIQVSTVETKFQ
jgi:hypothetical protein